MRAKIHFDGSFFEYGLTMLGLILLTIVTLGLAFPYLLYWSIKYFFTQLSVGDADIVYTGSFGDYFLKSLLLFLLTILTLGLLTPYYTYWNYKYFFENLELEAQPEPRE